MFIQPVRFIKQLFAERRGRKTSSALVATAFEDAASALRFHSLTKTVNFALLTFLGLISSFHNVLRKSAVCAAIAYYRQLYSNSRFKSSG